MSATNPSAFQREFPAKALFRDKSLLALLWGIPNALILLLLLLNLFLLVDLFFSRGQLPDPLVQEMSEDRDLKLSLARRIDAVIPPETEDGVEQIDLERFRTADAGILPAVWWSRDTLWGPLFGRLYAWFPALRHNDSALITLVLAGIVLSLLRSLCHSMIRRHSDQAGAAVTTRVQKKIHRQALRLSPAEINPQGTDRVIQLVGERADQAQAGITEWVATLSRCPLELAVLVLMIFSLDWRIAIQCLIPVLACWFLIQRARNRAELQRKYLEAQTDADVRLLNERVTNTRLVRGYHMEEFDLQQFEEQLNRLHQRKRQARQGEGWSHWVTRISVTICAALIIFFVGNRTFGSWTTQAVPGGEVNAASPLAEPFPLATAVLLLVCFLAAQPVFSDLWNLRRQRRRAAESLDLIQRYLDETPEVSQAVGAKFLNPVAKAITFESVVFTPPHARKPVLNGLDLKIPAGEITAIVSLDPKEPQALTYLLPRFIEPTSGRVLYDGEDTGWVTLESLRAETVFVSARNAYFTGTVKDNIACGNTEVAMNDITDAAKMSHANHFILKLAGGYETMLGEHGETLNVGQAFRLSLARAILRNPAVMIIEEPDEELDTDTKALIDDAYQRVFNQKTIIILPSRLSTLRRAHRIVLLHQGRVEAIGPHATLVNHSALYRHWEYIKFNEFRHESAAS